MHGNDAEIVGAGLYCTGSVDLCGVCNGDNTECEISDFSINFDGNGDFIQSKLRFMGWSI